MSVVLVTRPDGQFADVNLRPPAATEKILAATRFTQGQRANDFAGTEDGEPVVPAFTCDSDRGDPDGHCGCARAFDGTRTLKSVTTAIVAEAPAGTLTVAVAAWYRRFFGRDDLEADLEAAVAQDVADLTRIAGTFPVGTVLERRGDTIQARRSRAREERPTSR